METNQIMILRFNLKLKYLIDLIQILQIIQHFVLLIIDELIFLTIYTLYL